MSDVGVFGGPPFGAFPWGGDPEAVFPTAAESERIWFLDGRESDQATLAVVGDALMPVANLQTVERAKRFRLDGTVGAITFAFPYPVAANALVWDGHNHSSAGLYKLRGADSPSAVLSDPVVFEDWRSVWPLGSKPLEKNWMSHTSLFRFTNTRLLRYWRLDIADTGVGLTYLQASRVMLGIEWQPDINVSFGAKRRITNSDSPSTSAWGAKNVAGRPTGRTFVLPFEVAEEADAIDHAEEMQRALGTSKDLVCAIDPAQRPGLHRQVMRGRLAETGDFEPKPVWSSNGMVWSFALNLEEVIS